MTWDVGTLPPDEDDDAWWRTEPAEHSTRRLRALRKLGPKFEALDVVRAEAERLGEPVDLSEDPE
ncbi:hypothetical protein [Antribacter gilvus]|uniref:hypothetical protein n=1 Tax=Antribacter gilvus TaxID=2304675 RepID=UPI000F7B8218|nr:hypothetical protein [Antribacter gilvus]